MKIKIVCKIIIILIGFVGSINLYAAFFENNAEGWHWYHDSVVEEELVPITPKNSAITVPHTPSEILRAYQKELEKRLHKAWVYPSYQNIQAYQEMQKDLTERSQNFSETWMKVVYQNPELDHTLVSPVNQKSRHIYLDQEKQLTTETIQSLKEDYGLFFFFSGQCEYCYQFAPIVQQFAKNYGWKVIAISVDGASIPGFTETLPDNGLLQKWGVKFLPSLFAVNPTTGHVLPIAYGLTALDQMELRIMTLLKDTRGK